MVLGPLRLVFSHKIPKTSSFTMRIAYGVFVAIITLFVYIYFCNIDLNYFTKVQKNEPRHAIPIDSPFQSLVQDQSQYPNLPIDLWMKHPEWSGASNVSDAQYRRIFNLQFNNNYWQVFQSTNETFQLLNAYYDNRANNPQRPSIRIVGMINTKIPATKTYCLLWFEDLAKPILTSRIHYHWMWLSMWNVSLSEKLYEPYLLSCRIPRNFHHKIPSAVSVVENQTMTVSNVLRLIYIKPSKKKQFAVCVKGLNFLDLDISVRLVEWLELLKILGADNVYFYNMNVHPNISKVLDHYQSLGYVNVVPHSLPGEYINIPLLQHKYLIKKVFIKRYDEVIVYTDCLYRNLYSYKYIVILDIDEIIVPEKTYMWSELLQSVEERIGKNAYSICTRVGFFLDKMSEQYGYIQGIPRYLHMLQHVYRHKIFPKAGFFTKCFHNPDFVISVHNHLPLARFQKSSLELLHLSEAKLQHYRNGCIPRYLGCGKIDKKNIIFDTSIWKYKDELIFKSINTLKELNFL